jgi:hypothetical protein
MRLVLEGIGRPLACRKIDALLLFVAGISSTM